MTAPGRSRDLRSEILGQRARLGDLLATLDEAEWDTPSLCRGWRVRDVVAHCLQNHRAAPWNVLGQMVVVGFSVDARNQRWVVRWRALSSTRLLAEYRATMDRTNFPGFEARYALTEDVVHGFDIARPLGRNIEVPAVALITVAETYMGTDLILHGRSRCAGLAFAATDHAWAAGTGPEVRGPMASIVVAVAGRSAGLDGLSGPGVAILQRRLAQNAGVSTLSG